MIGKLVAIVMCAAACSAQLECGEIDVVRDPYYAVQPVYRSEPAYEYQEDFSRGPIQQRVDPRTYPVLLSGEAPEGRLPPVIQAPPVVTPLREKPVIRLPHPPIPQERVVSHKCLCTKTVIKPQIIQRVITVPKIQRYIRRGFRPVIENIAYASPAAGCENYEAPVEAVVPAVTETVAYRGSYPPPQFSQVSSIC